MDGKDGLILWTLGGAGVLLLYSAYTNKSPRVVLASTLGAPEPAKTNPVLLQPRGDFSHGASGSFDPGASGNFSGGTSGSFDATGNSFFFDADGNPAGVIPAPYQGSPNTFIPPGGTSFA